jgi:hypothetical protein
MHRSTQQRTSKQRVLFVESIVNHCNSLFRQVPQEDDFGLDAEVEFSNDGRLSGQLIALQIKAGPSYRTQGGYRIPADERHFRRWVDYMIPVAGIVVDLNIDRAFWVNISDYLARNPGLTNTDPYVIPVSATNEFSNDTFTGSFRNSFGVAPRVDLARVTDLYLSDDPAERWQGFLGLISRQWRFTRVTPLMLARGCMDENVDIRAATADALSRYLLHPEVGFFPPVTLGVWTERVIIQNFDERTVRLLLEAVDENGFERGSFGQSFAVVLDKVPAIGDVLLSIGLDSHADQELRHNALALVG